MRTVGGRRVPGGACAAGIAPASRLRTLRA